MKVGELLEIVNWCKSNGLTLSEFQQLTSGWKDLHQATLMGSINESLHAFMYNMLVRARDMACSGNEKEKKDGAHWLQACELARARPVIDAQPVPNIYTNLNVPFPAPSAF
jgi:hypothetical protein